MAIARLAELPSVQEFEMPDSSLLGADDAPQEASIRDRAAGPDDDEPAEKEDPDLAFVEDAEADDPVDDDRLSDALGDPP